MDAQAGDLAIQHHFYSTVLIESSTLVIPAQAGISFSNSSINAQMISNTEKTKLQVKMKSFS